MCLLFDNRFHRERLCVCCHGDSGKVTVGASLACGPRTLGFTSESVRGSLVTRGSLHRATLALCTSLHSEGPGSLTSHENVICVLSPTWL